MMQDLGTGGAAGTRPEEDGILAFDGFRLDVKGRALYQDGQPVHMRPRELDILIYLAQHSGRVIPKAELIANVWRGQTVSDANVRVQMSAVRRILGEGSGRQGFIDVLPRHGYRFRPDAPAATSAQPLSARPAPPRDAGTLNRRHNLPVRVKRFYGRDADCGLLLTRLADHRLVTIVGPGGIGKSTLALSAAERLIDTFDDGVRFVDLAGLTEANLVPGTLAATLGIALGPNAAPDALIAGLAPRQILFVVDNCEHLIDAVAALIESILRRTRHIRFISTSREPLRIDEECLCRLGPLELPPQMAGMAPSRIAAYAAVQLFNDRASQGSDTFLPSDAQMPMVAALCRRLDGSPLAIELVAARMSLFGLDGLAGQLDENLGLHIQGRRTATPRHKTLRATLDWSYNLLPVTEQRLLNRLSIFRGAFPLEAIARVADFDGDTDLLHSLAELVAKSLISVDRSSSTPLYRMLLLTREYALERLTQSGEHELIAERHAAYFLELMTSTGRDRGVDAEAWVADVDAAINWGLGVPGHPDLACHLVRAAFNIMERFSRLSDRGQLIERALERIGDGPDTETLGKLGLHIQRAHILQFTSADEGTLLRWAAQTDLLADRIFLKTGDETGKREMLAFRCGMAFSRCDTPELMRLAGAGERARTTEPVHDLPRMRFERWLFQAHHFAGDPETAQSYIAKVLSYPNRMLNERQLFTNDYISLVITARIFKARVLWLQGDPVSATEIALEAQTLSLAHPPNVTCYVMAFATIPIALWRGDDAAAQGVMAQFGALATDQGLGYWAGWKDLYAFVQASGDNSPIALPPGLVKNAFHADHLATLCLADHALADERVASGLVGWTAPEVLRRRAEWDLVTGRSSRLEAEKRLMDAVDLARAQKTPAWQLRSACSLARLRHTQGRTLEGLDVLRTALSPFALALPDRDFVAARTLMSEMEAA